MATKRGSKTDPNAWRSVNPAPIMLLHGPEDLIAQRFFDKIRGELKEATPDIEFSRLSASEYNAGELLVLASPSLFGESKLLYFEQLEKMNDAFLADALEYIQQPAEDVMLLCRHTGGNRGKKLLDQLKKVGVVVDCSRISTESAKLEFLRGEFKAARRRIDQKAVRALLDAVGSSLAELAAASDQLISDTEGVITEEMVDQYYGGRVQATAFKVADAALEGRTGEALTLLRHSLKTGAQPPAIIGAFAMKARQIATIIDAKLPAGQVPSALGVAPWQAQRVSATTRFWTPPKIAQALEHIAQADADVKGLARTPEFSVEKMVLDIASSAKTRR